MMNYSKQRERILAYLTEKKNHPTAEQIYSELKQDAPTLSLATVYRNLNLLCRTGQAQRLDTGEVDRFDADTSDHAHFICESCHKMFDVYAEDLVDPARAQSAVGAGYSVSGHRLFLYGKCPQCNHPNS